MKYHLVKEHENSFEVEHPDGSSFHIAKYGLSDDIAKRIQSIPVKLADGGEVPDQGESIDLNPSGEQDISNLQSAQQKASEKPEIVVGQYKPGQSMLPGLEDLEGAKIPPPESNEIASSKETPAEQGLNGAPGPGAPTQPRVWGGNKDQTQQGAGPQIPVTPKDQNFLDKMQSNQDLTEKGIVGMQTAQAKTAQEQARVYQGMVGQMQKVQENYKTQLGLLDSENAQLTKDVVNAKIDPTRLYHEGSSTGGKIAAAIGVILGGIGSGLSGEPNMAIKVISDSIDRDVQAQKANLGKKENLLSINLRKYGNLQTATQATTAQLHAVAQGQIAQAAAQNGSAEAAGKAQLMIAESRNKMLPLQSEIAYRQAGLSLISGGSGGPEGTGATNGMKPEQVDSLKVRFMVPEKEQPKAYEELTAIQKIHSNQEGLNQAFDKAVQLNTVGNRILSPLESKRQIDALVQPRIAALSKETAGKLTETDMEAIGHLMPQIGDPDKVTKTKRSEMNRILTEKAKSSLLLSYGIEPKGRYSLTGQSDIPEVPKR